MPRKILIVDDQEDMLLILEREFRRLEGATVTTTSKFADVLGLVTSKEIDLVISDVRIGLDSGFDLAREIGRAHPEVGTILMSAYRSASNRQQAADLGVLVFLEKPFPIPRLLEAVRSFFQQREQPAPEPVAPAAPAAPVAAGATSSLAHFKLQDLVQLFCLNGRNVRITVAWETKAPAGEIHIQRGQVIHADFGGKTGEEAFHDLMQVPRSILRVNDWAAPVPVTISTGWELLLLHAAIRVDELQDDQDMPGQSVAGL
jgi:DNA-binding response OmpR family regulator